MAAPYYNLAELELKNIRFLKRIPIRAWPGDDSPIVGYVKPGQVFGPLESILGINSKSSHVHFLFLKRNGGGVYIPLVSGSVDVDHLRAQGVRSTTEVRKAERPLIERIADNAGEIIEAGTDITKFGLLILGGIVITKILRK